MIPIIPGPVTEVTEARNSPVPWWHYPVGRSCTCGECVIQTTTEGYKYVTLDQGRVSVDGGVWWWEKPPELTMEEFITVLETRE